MRRVLTFVVCRIPSSVAPWLDICNLISYLEKTCTRLQKIKAMDAQAAQPLGSAWSVGISLDDS